MKRFRIQLVWAAIVLICGVSLMAAVYLLFNKPEVYINPGIVVTSPAPTASPVSPVTSHYTAVSYSPFRHASYGYTYSYHASSSASSMQAGRGLYLHSSAEVHSVGGGGSGTIALGRRRRKRDYRSCHLLRIGFFAGNQLYARRWGNDADDEFLSRCLDASDSPTGSAGSAADGADGFAETRTGTAYHH